MTLPTGPDHAPYVLQVGRAIVATDFYAGRPAIYNPPELAEPEEPAELGEVFLYLPSKKRWVPIDLRNAPHLEEQILEKVQEKLDGDYDDYAIEMDMERDYA